MTTPIPSFDPSLDDEFLDVARRALTGAETTTVLDELGWWELLPQLDVDAEARRAVLALFRAHGHALAGSPALGGLLAQPFLAGATDVGRVVAPVPRTSPRRVAGAVVVGDLDGCRLLLDRPGHGAAIVDPAAVELRAIDVPGRLPIHEVIDDGSRWDRAIDESACVPARARRTFLGRVAIALEILGAAEAAVELAVEYAGQREQFGEPIGRFQAVRHLLAWARTDCEAIAAVTRDATALDVVAPPRYDEVAKAIAGRNGRRACERALQVLGGIGFTAEHEHHHLHGRVLVLDALLGTSAELTHGLGEWLRTTGADPGFPAAVLTPGRPT